MRCGCWEEVSRVRVWICPSAVCLGRSVVLPGTAWADGTPSLGLCGGCGLSWLPWAPTVLITVFGALRGATLKVPFLPPHPGSRTGWGDAPQSETARGGHVGVRGWGQWWSEGMSRWSCQVQESGGTHLCAPSSRFTSSLCPREPPHSSASTPLGLSLHLSSNPATPTSSLGKRLLWASGSPSEKKSHNSIYWEGCRGDHMRSCMQSANDPARHRVRAEH